MNLASLTVDPGTHSAEGPGLLNQNGVKLEFVANSEGLGVRLLKPQSLSPVTFPVARAYFLILHKLFCQL